ncbi:MAG: alpha-amylase family glycosyl hydrolase, partial [Clostridia bacterium]
MASNTPKSLRNQVLYSVFVRNHSAEGTFQAVEKDLDRIQKLGVDIIWLMPIHPVGVKARKGKLGSPYAIENYRAINAEFGTFEDFVSLINAIHSRGMRCIIDVVFNHTSPDSELAKQHPEWFYHKADGSFGNKVGEWPDVIDLDFQQAGLWDELIDTLKMWARYVDGFRCDVAPLIPLEFWLRARAEVAQINANCIWLSESVEPAFTLDNRERGMVSLSDGEIFTAFDISYEYDIFADFNACLESKISLAAYAEAINRQEFLYPDNYVKLRFLENHDRPRAKLILPNEQQLRNWTAFLYFQKGMTLLYAGQECENTLRPSLFERDTVQWNTGYDLSALLAALYAVKKHPLLTNSRYFVQDAGNGMLLATHRAKNQQLLGIFSTQ